MPPKWTAPSPRPIISWPKSYIKEQDWSRAYLELSRTVELQPDNYKAHVDMANLLVAAVS